MIPKPPLQEPAEAEPYLGVQNVPGCCGIRELTSLSQFNKNPQKAFRGFANVVYRPVGTRTYGAYRFRYAVFSEANPPRSKSNSYGRDFAAFIIKHGLGEVVETGRNRNPNSSNDVQVWIWTVDHDACRALAEEMKIPVAKTDRPPTP